MGKQGSMEIKKEARLVNTVQQGNVLVLVGAVSIGELLPGCKHWVGKLCTHTFALGLEKGFASEFHLARPMSTAQAHSQEFSQSVKVTSCAVP